jgi:Tfp pilus assembly protein FimT
MSNLQVLSPSQNARLFAARQREGSDVRSLLCFPETEITQVIKTNDKDEKRGINFTHRNMKMLRLKQEQIRKQNQEKQTQNVQVQEKDKKLKESKFQHVKPKVFEDKTTEICNNSLCSIQDFQKVPQTTLHKNYGQVPSYILKFRIANANKENEHNLSIPSPEKTVEAASNKHERMKLLTDLSLEESRITKMLAKMPFGIQSDQSVQKRSKLENDLKRLRMKKSKLLI